MSKSLIKGAIFGAIASGLVVLATTPKSGKEMRGKVKYTIENWQEVLGEIKDNIQAVSSGLIDVTKTGRETLLPFVSEVKASITKWRQDISPHQTKIQGYIQEVETALSHLESLLKQ